ncbi:MAG: inositol monophosphatase [[Clostridium] fimetarium]|nr:inositol monophosphatase [Alistipes timonensis]MCM1406411.1 inositol monophosphatase [[Clostridium] fimetarium]
MKLTQYLPDIPREYQPLMAAALEMAESAGAAHMRYFRKSNLEQTTKQNDSDVVTIADKESEAVILSYIRRHFPTHGIISEESGGQNEEREWRWVVDPLDGTTNFAAGLPGFCVSIALERNRETVLGVVFAPYLGECFYGVRGGGAWLNGAPLRCSAKTELSKAVVATGMPYDRNENPDNNLAEIGRMALRVRGVRRLGSAAIDLCYTAAGFFDAYWELNLNRWDISAGTLIATEAGAVVESIRANRNHSILACAPSLHAEIRGILLP